MMFLKLLRPGIKVKRYVFSSFIGISILVLVLTNLIIKNNVNTISDRVLIVILVIISMLIIYKSIAQCVKSVVALVNKGYINITFDENIEDLIDEDRLLVKGPKIVVIGGGTGLSTMLRGLKYYTSNVTSIVTVGDDGGGSGILREDLGMLPPGDIRNCILALADTEPLMEELLEYRFKDGRLKGQNFGNLFLAAMDGISDNFEDAVRKMSSVLAVKGDVLPVTLEDMVLEAELKNGHRVRGESIIGDEVLEQNSPIKRLRILPEDAKALDAALKAIDDADAIVLGPGSLYTSVLPNLLVKGINKHIKKSNALKMYICNVMTQPGETDGFEASAHLKVLINHCGKDIVDCIIANEQDIPEGLKEKYALEKSELVQLDIEQLNKMGIEVIKGDLTDIRNSYVRHNSEYLAQLLIETVMEKQLLYDRKKILEYIYLTKRIKDGKR
ncbi:gluconeogenesis factor YvcK family protein [Clostridium tarantellae]|uniref:Putative gluconeogenesis factor n=1 Tax=Clostridium tarantellae TaxID=39493 RepID=A0A6I1MP89_9CLOT|nr:gluconeogenesis factor YvcK family protein [Clostridium tarantellae]MPQ42691.1 uridine diphosphate-N-acetylglucosamine-binding protein YvcK [Clostridium tarantellae]